MRDIIEIFLFILVYTVTFFWFGMAMQKYSDNLQLKKFTDVAWTDGCKRCAQFEKDSCERDQLQGTTEHPNAPLKTIH